MQATMTVREAASRLGCTLKYVYDLVYGRKLKSEKSGRRWLISIEAVEAWIAARGGNGE
jgi:excisionase family DNA binding protein